jgi:hypothetical protein
MLLGAEGGSPLGKSQELLQLSGGIDVTQRVLGVDEDEASDLHTLKLSIGQKISVPPQDQSHSPTRWG